MRIFPATLVALLVLGCSPVSPRSLDWIAGTAGEPATGPALRVLWTQRISREWEGPYVPVENAGPTYDALRDRLYIGSADGGFLALGEHGRRLYRYDPEAGVEAAAVVDLERGDVFLAAEDGRVHALDGQGQSRWKESAGGPIRQAPVLTDDSIFLAREDDAIVAMSREDGELFWTYAREGTVEYSISGRAGLLLEGDRIYTGFSDGTVVALDASDGSVVWERVTAVDFEPREGDARSFYDVDATPVLHDGVLYAASVSAGLYALDLDSGSVIWRDGERTGITGIAAYGRLLFFSSVENGLTAYDVRRRQVAWHIDSENGAPSRAVVAGDILLVAESLGSLRAFHIRTGEEIGRIDAGTGFSSPPTVVGRAGWILSNGGSLIAFSI